MPVGVRVPSNMWVVGSPDFLFEVFSAIGARLEPDGWGSRFPVVMHELYAGELAPERAPAALAELDQIREELAGCFLRDDGRDVLELIAEAVAYSARCGQPARVQKTLLP